MQQRDAARQVVEHQQRCRGGKRGVGHAGLRLGVSRQFLEQAHDIVARNADEAAGERQLLDVGLRHGRERQGLAQCAQVLGLAGGPGSRVAVDGEGIRVHANLEGVAKAQERVAREPLAALDALEQVARL